MSRATTRAALFAALLAAGAAGAAGDPAATPAAASEAGLGAPSPAEQLLFMHPQLASIHEARTLSYDYVTEAPGAPRSTDRVTLALTLRADGVCCSTHTEFLSGPQAIHLPDLDDPQGNPIVMYFLESEVRLLERTTHGQPAHFRRRIRQQLADDATVTDATARWNGRDVPTRVVHFVPFTNDPYRQRFERESATVYDFVLADGVPGGLLRVSATIPGAKAGDPPLATRTLSLADPQPATPAKR